MIPSKRRRSFPSSSAATTRKSVPRTPSSNVARRAPLPPSSRSLSTSSLSSISSSSSSSNDLNRSGPSSSGTSGILCSTHKRYQASVSSESVPRTYTKSLPTIPRSPRPQTPYERSKMPTYEVSPASKMDISNVDVDASSEMDKMWLRTTTDHGKKNNDMVSTRVRPSNTDSAQLAPSSAGSSIGSRLCKSGVPLTRSTRVRRTNPSTSQSYRPMSTPPWRDTTLPSPHTARLRPGKIYIPLSGDEGDPAIIPRVMKGIFRFNQDEGWGYLLCYFYLEIYNKNFIHDPLSPVGSPAVFMQTGRGSDIIFTPLCKEVVTSQGVKDVLKRGESHRCMACTELEQQSKPQCFPARRREQETW
ncbi:uncharacterized protein ARMOST_02492 [Armillaria ostoyae]|uniref:Kinesin motor domain-containing protein n=1 Tax=Armillaria ostoyae TaxID=47428 RepID=A0A284QS32_ARMOS|nr:uncharacterized protein ARMOST_02492 [Armillaria ostoyae]